MLGVPPDELAARTDHTELVELDAFEHLNGPQTRARDDVLTGIVASVVANANRDTKKKPRPFEPREFMPQWRRVRQRPGDVWAQIKAWAAGHNAAAKRGKRSKGGGESP